jgi:hypothetical protein
MTFVEQNAEDTEKRTDITFFDMVEDIFVFGMLAPTGTKAFKW